MSIPILLSMAGCAGNQDPQNWNSQKTANWFEKGDWLNGWSVRPDQSIDKQALAVSYYNNRERWDKAFEFLRNNDLMKLELKRYDIDGENLFATASEYVTKNEVEARFEAHRKYIDIQYVAYGKEMIGLAPASLKNNILEPYDETKDIEFMTVVRSELLKAGPGRFFIFFPHDLHMPGLKDGQNAQVRKIVIKVRID